MKRLFQINKPNGKVYSYADGTPLYYDNKPEAKRGRDDLNNQVPDGGYTVSPGPDHKGHLPKRTRGHRRANRAHNDRGN